MNKTNQYQWDHLLAKGIVSLIYVLVGVVSIETNNPYFALVIGTQVWLFGVNTAGYFVEKLTGHCHLHNRV